MSMVDPEGRGVPRAMRHVSRYGFNFLNYSTLIGLYDFGQPSTLFTDTSRTTPVATAGDAIAGMTELSVTAWHASQATGAKRPTYQPNVVNGWSVGRFAGTHGLTSLTKTTFAQPFTLIAVAKQTSKATSGRVIDSSDNDLNRALMGFTTAGFAEIYAAAGPIADAIDHSGAFVIESAVINGASSKIYVNGALTLTGNAGASRFGSINQIGWDAFNGITGDIALIAALSGAVPTADHNIIGNALASRFALGWTLVS